MKVALAKSKYNVICLEFTKDLGKIVVTWVAFDKSRDGTVFAAEEILFESWFAIKNVMTFGNMYNYILREGSLYLCSFFVVYFHLILSFVPKS